MSRQIIVLGLLLAAASIAAAWGLTLFNDPRELGRARALAMGLCLAGPVLGIVAGAASRDLQAANWVGAVNLLVLGLGFCGWMLPAWDGSWDLPAIVGFALLVQTAMVLLGGWLRARRR